VSWNEFCTVFYEHHILAGIMCHNLWEFLDLHQGTDSVYEYIKKFNYLAQYGAHHVSTDDKKAELFIKGLSLPLQDRLVLFRDVSFNALVSATIEQEGICRALLIEEEEKRKRAVSGPLKDSTAGAPPKYHLVYTPSAGRSRVPPLHWDHHQPQQQHMLPQMHVQTQQQQMLPQAPVQSPQPVPPCPPQKTVVTSATCFNCGCVGHIDRQCPEPKSGKAPRVPVSTVIQQRCQIRAPTPRSGRVNHTTVKDIPEGEEVLTGTFLLFVHPIIILFDSGVSHDFMSAACAKGLKLALTVAKPSYMISTPGG
jgi:hypothetical protein